VVDNLRDQLYRDEGLRLHPYEDTVGKLTVGVGRNLDDKGISEEEADAMLSNDIQEVEEGLANEIPWIVHLDDVRKAVLLNMAFNLGVGGLMSFSNMLQAVQEWDWEWAGKEMENSRWWNQVGRRAARLKEQMVTGEWQ